MTTFGTRLARYGLILLGVGASAGCDPVNIGGNPPIVSLSLGTSSGTVEQGHAIDVNALLSYDPRLNCQSPSFNVTGGNGLVHATHTPIQFIPVGANALAGFSTVLTLSVDDVPAAQGNQALTIEGVCGVNNSRQSSLPYALTVTAHPAAPSFQLSLSPAALSIAQGGNSPTTTVNIGRINFTGDVALSVAGLPAGITAAFTPATLQTQTSSVLTLTVAPGFAIGPVLGLSVQGVGTAGTVSTPLSLTITAGVPAGNFTLTTSPLGPVSVIQGTSTTVDVLIVRTGGNSSNVALTVPVTPPNGMSLSFGPPNTTGAGSVLTIGTTGATPIGPATIVIHGNAAGLQEQLLNLTVNVTAPSGVPNVTLSFATCAVRPVWVARMDGTAGSWIAMGAVPGMPDVYTFRVNQPKGSYAYVTTGAGPTRIFVQHRTQAELTAAPIEVCGPAVPNGNAMFGSVANLPAGAQAILSFARDETSTSSNGAFNFSHAQNGSFDLVGFAGSRAFVKPAEISTSGGTFSVPVDFTHATLSAPVASASAGLTGLTGSDTDLYQSMTFFTGGTACVPAFLYSEHSPFTNFTIRGIPAGLRAVSGDMHSVGFVASSSSLTRSLDENFLDINTRALTAFVLPTPLPAPTVTDLGGPYRRPSVAVAAVPAEFDLSHTLSYQNQSTTTPKFGTVSASQAWVGGPGLTLSLPNFSGVGPFQDSWAPAAAETINWQLRSAGGVFPTVCGVGQRAVASTRLGTI